MVKSISLAIIAAFALFIGNLLPAAATANRGGGSAGEDDFNDRVSKTGVSAIKRPFFVGSRYGRSDYFGNQKQLSIQPRNDRFFLQSRYGKRSMELTTNNFSEQLDKQQQPQEQEEVPLICLFTGVTDLYRCQNLEQGETSRGVASKSRE